MPTPSTPPLGELLEHRDFVQRLARHLVRDESAADDLEQDVWIAALKRPLRLESARAWLTQVTRNLASNSARGEARRKAREAAVARSRPEVGLEQTERAFEVLKDVTAAVERLDEPYRATILLAYFRALPHAAIAAEMAVPVATVRTRLRRGLERLREDLDRKHEGHRAAWLGGLAAFADLPKPAALATQTAGTSLLTTTALMGLATKLTAAAAAVALVWIWSPWQATETQPGSEPAAALEPDLQPNPAEAALGVTPHSAETTGRREAIDTGAQGSSVSLSGAPATHGWFVACELPELTKEQAQQTTVTIRGENGYRWPDELVATGNLDPESTVKIDVTELLLGGNFARTPLHALLVTATSPMHLPTTLRLPASEEHHVMAEPDELEADVLWHAELGLQSAAVVTGVVLHEDGSPVAGALVTAWHAPMIQGAVAVGVPTNSDAQGLFRLKLPATGTYVLAALAEGLQPASQEVRVDLAQKTPLDEPLVLADGAVLAGVALARGQPIPLARVSVGLVSQRTDHFVEAIDARQNLVLRSGALWRSRTTVTCDENGAWIVAGLTPGNYKALVAGVPKEGTRLSGYPQGEVIVSAPARDIQLEYGYARIRLNSKTELPTDKDGHIAITQAKRPPFVWSFSTRNPIRVIAGTPGEEVAVRIALSGFEPWDSTITFPEAGALLEIPFELARGPAPGSLSLEITSDERELPKHLWLGLYPASEGSHELLHDKIVDVEDGKAHFGELMPGHYRAKLRVVEDYAYSSPSNYIDAELQIEIEPAKQLKREILLELGGKLSLFAHNASGTPLPAQYEVRDAQGNKLEARVVATTKEVMQSNTWQLSTRAPNLSYPNLPAGKYELAMWLDGYTRKSAAFKIQPGETTVIDWQLDAE